MTKKPYLSFIVPTMNEEETIVELFEGIKAHAEPVSSAIEVIFIDDGSTDQSWSRMEQLAAEYPKEVKLIRKRRNFGKANALAAGYKRATGDFVFTMDADLQDDPAEIPNFLQKIVDDKLDIVTGHKQRRNDPWHKVLPSRIFNSLISRVGGVSLHDHNCGFKCYRREVVKVLPMYGGMHRMVPTIAGIFGFETGEIVVRHHPRVHGKSKYGTRRFFHGIADIITIGFIRRYRERPNHVMATASLLLGLFSILTAALVGFFDVPRFLLITGVVISTAGLTSGLLLFFNGIIAELNIWSQMQVDTESDSEVVESRNDVPTQPFVFRSRRKALVADDDPRVNRLITEMLKREDWEVVSAKSADEAIEAIDEEISIAFVDVHMPGRDHSTALKELQTRAPSARLVSFSGDKSSELPDLVREAGAACFLPKPVARRELIGQANEALN